MISIAINSIQPAESDFNVLLQKLDKFDLKRVWINISWAFIEDNVSYNEVIHDLLDKKFNVILSFAPSLSHEKMGIPEKFYEKDFFKKNKDNEIELCKNVYSIFPKLDLSVPKLNDEFANFLKSFTKDHSKVIEKVRINYDQIAHINSSIEIYKSILNDVFSINKDQIKNEREFYSNFEISTFSSWYDLQDNEKYFLILSNVLNTNNLIIGDIEFLDLKDNFIKKLTFVDYLLSNARREIFEFIYESDFSFPENSFINFLYVNKKINLDKLKFEKLLNSSKILVLNRESLNKEASDVLDEILLNNEKMTFQFEFKFEVIDYKEMKIVLTDSLSNIKDVSKYISNLHETKYSINNNSILIKEFKTESGYLIFLLNPQNKKEEIALEFKKHSILHNIFSKGEHIEGSKFDLEILPFGIIAFEVTCD